MGLNNYCHMFISHFLLLDMVHTTVASPWPISSSYWHMGIACEPPQPQFETLVAVFFDSILWIWEIKTQRYRVKRESPSPFLFIFLSFFKHKSSPPFPDPITCDPFQSLSPPSINIFITTILLFPSLSSLLFSKKKV